MSSLTQSKTIKIPTARVFEPLLHPSRYKGDGGAIKITRIENVIIDPIKDNKDTDGESI